VESGTLISASAPDYAAVLPDAGRLGGLDVGTKTIGLATCDSSWSFASPACR
jgi:putative Holliday junction resolvase